jgi:hypothetical protein
VGRAKAGKSTLLNALVGERVAPTDMSECTRYVTWYEDGLDYSAVCLDEVGGARPVTLRRTLAGASIDLPSLSLSAFSELKVTLPSRRLRQTRLADTPGFDSTDPEIGARTRHLITPASDGEGIRRVDAIVYLLRYVHRADMAFLEDVDGVRLPGTPINSLGVLSRADELLDAGLDAMDSAQVVARSYSLQTQVRQKLHRVIAVSGLLAETAATLLENEFGWLRQLSREPEDEVRRMLRSIDGFCDAPNSPLQVLVREQLVNRFGLFGLRWSENRIRTGVISDSSALARDLAAVSGVSALRELLDAWFELRSRRLIYQSVLSSLRAAVTDHATTQATLVAKLLPEIERIENTSHELDELRLLDAAVTDEDRFRPQEVDEINRLVRDASPWARLGLPESELQEDAVKVASDGAARWRQRAESPLATPNDKSLFEIAARSYEGIYLDLLQTNRPS